MDIKKERILVIDDEEGIREYVRWILEDAGYEVLEAEDGNKALEVFFSTPVDLIITDLVMPDKEGIETISDLRREHPNLKIIAMSGAVDSATYLMLASNLGALATIQKPFDSKKLLETVERILSE